MMNVRFSLLNMHGASNFRCNFTKFLVKKANKMLISKILNLMGVLFKHVQYWLTKEIHRYPYLIKICL